ncbi:MAG: HD domain-containing protein [Myxococcota bacterium]|nr:HD domain-containing protein [Myxococcota bacterium]
MILRDPVHGLVAFEGDEERIVEQLMGAREVQRLRRIRQLGVTSLAFPGAEHSRFAHVVGAAFVMKLLLARLRVIHGELPEEQRVTRDRAREALAAAFVHDVGHGPLSHLFEDAIPGTPEHETWTERIVLDSSTDVNRILTAVDRALPTCVVDLVHGRHPLPYLARAVSGELDVDRCDYLLRDAHATGVRYGIYDLDWLLRSLRFAPGDGNVPASRPASDGRAGMAVLRNAPALAIDGAKGLPAIEAFITARLFMFQQVYLHKATRAAEWMIRQILARAVWVLREGGALSSVPGGVLSAARAVPISLGDYLELDDGVLWGAMHAWEGARDQALADLCRRIRARALFKTLELFGEHATADGRERALAVARDVAAVRGFDAHQYVGLDVASVEPFGAESEPLMVVFAKGPARPLHEVSFLLSRLAGQVLSRVRLILAPELRDPVVDALGM